MQNSQSRERCHLIAGHMQTWRHSGSAKGILVRARNRRKEDSEGVPALAQVEDDTLIASPFRQAVRCYSDGSFHFCLTS